MPRMTISDRGLAMIKRFEGFQPEALQLPDGQWLIGHGCVRMSQPEGPITPHEAHADLMLDLVAYEDLIHARVTAPLSQAQFDALASFAFSIGTAAFERSDVLRRINAGDVPAAAAAMDAWRKSSLFGEAQVLDALIRRRALERAWLLDAEDAPPAPSALVQAQLDHAAAILGAPAKVAAMTSLEQAIAMAATPPAPQRLEAVADPVAMRIATILADEPTTALALVRAPQAPDAAMADEPAPETQVQTSMEETPQPQTPVAAAAAAQPTSKSRIPKWFAAAMDSVALLGLLLMGLGLLALAGLAVSYGADNGGGLLTAAVLGGPGALAVAMAAFYLIKGSAGPEA